jgi:hypothetical protein
MLRRYNNVEQLLVTEATATALKTTTSSGRTAGNSDKHKQQTKKRQTNSIC